MQTTYKYIRRIKCAPGITLKQFMYYWLERCAERDLRLGLGGRLQD